MNYIDTALKEGDLAVGDSRCVTVGAAKIGLFRTDEGLFALDNECPHRGGPLHEGFLRDGKVTCPWHQWDFQLSDGVCVNIPQVRVKTHPVEVRDGTIWVSLNGKGAK